MKDLEIVPHQNEHIEFMHRASEQLREHLSQRPLAVARFESAVLTIGDEPVVLTPRDGAPKGDLRNRLRIRGERVPAANLVQLSNGRDVGFNDADEVILPLSPRHALVYGGFQTSPWPSPVFDVDMRQTTQIARELNRLQARSAFGWVAAHPDGPHLAQIPWPPPAPAVKIYDDRSAPAEVVNSRPHARPHRFSK